MKHKVCLVSGTDETDYAPMQSYNVNNGSAPYIFATVYAVIPQRWHGVSYLHCCGRACWQ